MGIEGLPSLIKSEAPKAIENRQFSNFSGMKVGVDSSLVMHQVGVAIRGSGKDMVNERGELTSHLYGLFYKVINFYQNKMTPIFVFDGKPPDIKSKTIEKRQGRRTKAEQNLQNISDSEGDDYITNFKQTFKLTKANIDEAIILLDLMGVPYIQAQGEADPLLVWLTQKEDENGKHYIDGICSDDSDMLALGGSNLFKEMSKNMCLTKPVIVINRNKVLKEMGMTSEQFTNLCVLLGTDYCDRIERIGPRTAFKLIRDHGTVEKAFDYLHTNKKYLKGLVLKENGYTDNEQCIINARNYFLTAVEQIDKSNFVLTPKQLELRKVKEDALLDFLCVKHNFDPMRIKTGIERLKSYQAKMGIVKENSSTMHIIKQPIGRNPMFVEFVDNIEFLTSSSGEDMPNKNTPVVDAIKRHKSSNIPSVGKPVFGKPIAKPTGRSPVKSSPKNKSKTTTTFISNPKIKPKISTDKKLMVSEETASCSESFEFSSSN